MNNDNVGNGGSTQVEAKCNYALTGYKLWLGSVWTDGKRLLSDCGEQSIVIRGFHSLHEMRLDIVQANLTLSMFTEYE
jgi:hypothetical protein